MPSCRLCVKTRKLGLTPMGRGRSSANAERSRPAAREIRGLLWKRCLHHCVDFPHLRLFDRNLVWLGGLLASPGGIPGYESWFRCIGDLPHGNDPKYPITVSNGRAQPPGFS